MKKFIRSVTFLLFILICISVNAQDPTGGSGDFQLSETVILILTLITAIYEVVIRVLPTVKNYSIIGWIIRILQFLIPNKSTDKEKKLP